MPRDEKQSRADRSLILQQKQQRVYFHLSSGEKRLESDERNGKEQNKKRREKKEETSDIGGNRMPVVWHANKRRIQNRNVTMHTVKHTR